MNKYARAVRPGLAFVAVALLSLAPALASARTVKDSEEFSGFLAQARTEALQLQKSADEMNSFVHARASWTSEAAKIAEVKEHVNKLGEFVNRMNNVEAPSPWQKAALGDITPMVNELAANVTMTIFHLGENPYRLIFTSFPDYVAVNAELATDIAQMVSDYVAYGEAKNKAEELSFELDLPES